MVNFIITTSALFGPTVSLTRLVKNLFNVWCAKRFIKYICTTDYTYDNFKYLGKILIKDQMVMATTVSFIVTLLIVIIWLFRIIKDLD